MKSKIIAAAFAATLAAAPVAMAQEVVSAPLTDAGAAPTEQPPAPAEAASGDSGARGADVAQADPADDVSGNAAKLYQAVRSGRWLAAVAAALLLAVYVVRRFALRRVAWFQSRAGGWAVNFGLAAATAIAVEIQMGVVGLATILDALALGFTAAGAYEGVRDPKRKPLAETKPAA